MATASAHKSLTGKMLVILLLAGLTFSIYAAAKRGLAAVIAEAPRYAIERWRSGKATFDPPALDAMEASLLKAHQLYPDNPRLLEDLGRLVSDRQMQATVSDPEVRAAQQRALEFFRQSLVLQPGSGYAYINVAAVKLSLAQLDQEYFQALQRALERAPWVRSVAVLAIDLGAASWPLLQPPMRELIRQTIYRHGHWQMFDQKPALRDVLRRYGRPDLECLLERELTACPAA